MKTNEINTVTIVISCKDVYELFQAVYEQASAEVINVYIDVEAKKAFITLRMS